LAQPDANTVPVGGQTVHTRLIPMFFSIPSQIGYGALFALVFAESAGVPVPGETALLGAGALAAVRQRIRARRSALSNQPQSFHP
jgi:hypothetical protein